LCDNITSKYSHPAAAVSIEENKTKYNTSIKKCDDALSTHRRILRIPTIDEPYIG